MKLAFNKIFSLVVGVFLMTTAAVSHADTIVDIAVNNDDFSTLVSALQKANLVDTLSGAGPFTVFAPSNEAFAKLPSGTLDNLSIDDLTNILTLHVVSGEILSTDLQRGDNPVTSLEGESLDVVVNADGTVTVSSPSTTATITMVDIEGDNGVIHVIDTVLMP